MQNRQSIEDLLVARSTEPWLTTSKVKLFAVALLLVVVSEWIGTVTFQIGSGKIMLMPLIWAVVAGGCISGFSRYAPEILSVNSTTQWYAARLLQAALLLFIAKLGLLVGGSLPEVIASGWALIFQEFGHFFGTMIFGLPVALLLGIKREAIGATFSVGREPSLAIISEKFGMASPEGHGVLAEYLTGTVFGAIFIGLLAGFLASLQIFHPYALAMGAGIGSGSMMAAASAAIAGQQTPEVAKDMAVFAGAANLLTTTFGTYFTLLLSLPFTIWAYGILEPVLGKIALRKNADAIRHGAPPEAVADPHKSFSTLEWLSSWCVTAAIALVGNHVGFKTPILDAVPGMAIIFSVTLAGHIVFRLTRSVVPVVCLITLVGMAATYPSMPYAAETAALVAKVDMSALITPILAYAGLSIAKDLPAFRRLGWPIIVTSFMANTGTFLGATLIAELLGHQGGH